MDPARASGLDAVVVTWKPNANGTATKAGRLDTRGPPADPSVAGIAEASRAMCGTRGWRGNRSTATGSGRGLRGPAPAAQATAEPAAPAAEPANRRRTWDQWEQTQTAAAVSADGEFGRTAGEFASAALAGSPAPASGQWQGGGDWWDRGEWSNDNQWSGAGWWTRGERSNDGQCGGGGSASSAWPGGGSNPWGDLHYPGGRLEGARASGCPAAPAQLSRLTGADALPLFARSHAISSSYHLPYQNKEETLL